MKMQNGVVIKAGVFSICIILVFVSCATTDTSQNTSGAAPSSYRIGIYDSSERVLLGPAYINAVSQWLRRYEPKVITREDDYVKMTFDYDYLCEAELFIKEEEYEILVTVIERAYNEKKAQEIVTKMSGGILKSTENYLVRGTRVRDRTDRDGER
jgi:hypothetical protein